MQWRYAEEYILYEGKQGILKRPRYTVKYSIKESLGKRIRGCPLPKLGWCWWLWHERSAVPNTPAIMALQAISNIDVVLGAEKKTCHYYDNSKTQKGFFNHFHFSNKFVKRSPELGLYSQTCRIATGLAFQSRLGILKKVKFSHCKQIQFEASKASKRAESCTKMRAWVFRNGLRRMFGKSTGTQRH